MLIKTEVSYVEIYEESLPVGENLRARGVNLTAVCPHCPEPETELHLFFHYSFAKEVWDLGQFQNNLNPTNIRSMQQGIEASPLLRNLPPTGLGKTPLMPWIMWSLWTNRNKKIFEQKQISAFEIITQATISAREWMTAQTDPPKSHTLNKPKRNAPLQLDPDLIHCFTDPAWRSDTKMAGYGWIFINQGTKEESEDRSIATNISSPLMAEASALFLAQQQALDLGYRKVSFASDSQQLVKALNQEPHSKELHGILHDILHLSTAFDEIAFSFVPRELNRRADEIAKASLLSVLNSNSNVVPTEPV